MRFSFKKTIILLLAFLTQVMLAKGDQVLVLCLGENGHLAIETPHFNYPHGPFNKHRGPENIDFTANTHDSDFSLKTGCFDLPISRDEEQRAFSGMGYTSPPLQCVATGIRPIEPLQRHQTDRVSPRLIYEAEVLRILGTVVLLI